MLLFFQTISGSFYGWIDLIHFGAIPFLNSENSETCSNFSVITVCPKRIYVIP